MVRCEWSMFIVFRVYRLHRCLPLRDHDSQIAVTVGTGALEVSGQLVLSLRQAFVHHDPSNLQPEPRRQFFDAHGEPLKLKAGDLHDGTTATRHQNATANVTVRAKRMDRHCAARDEVSLVRLHQCNLFLPASIRMWVRSSTSGIRRDEVSMSRFSFSHLHSCISSSLIRSSCLSSSIIR